MGLFLGKLEFRVYVNVLLCMCVEFFITDLCFTLQCKQRFQKLKDVTDLQEKCKKLRDQLKQ